MECFLRVRGGCKGRDEELYIWLPAGIDGAWVQNHVRLPAGWSRLDRSEDVAIHTGSQEWRGTTGVEVHERRFITVLRILEKIRDSTAPRTSIAEIAEWFYQLRVALLRQRTHTWYAEIRSGIMTVSLEDDDAEWSWYAKHRNGRDDDPDPMTIVAAAEKTRKCTSCHAAFPPTQDTYEVPFKHRARYPCPSIYGWEAIWRMVVSDGTFPSHVWVCAPSPALVQTLRSGRLNHPRVNSLVITFPPPVLLWETGPYEEPRVTTCV